MYKTLCNKLYYLQLKCHKCGAADKYLHYHNIYMCGSCMCTLGHTCCDLPTWISLGGGRDLEGKKFGGAERIPERFQ